MKKINDLINNAEYFHHYQPIFNLDINAVIGFEVLFRSKLSYSPESAFRAARRVGRLYELETESLSKAICSEELGNLDESILLFINIFPSTLVNPNFFRYFENTLEKAQIKPERIVIEINEDEAIADISTFIKCLSALKKFGVHIALDDVGKGETSFRKIIELKPDYIKMDHYFGSDLANEQKREMVRSIVTYCNNTNTKFILEGIETKRDLIIAKGLNVSIGQGYLLGKPASLKSIKSVKSAL